MIITDRDRQRFESNFIKGQPDDCWFWTGSKFENGYGRFNFNATTKGAHRISYLIYNGPLKNGLIIMHKCDRKNCVNPNHLIQGTCLDNTRDMLDKKRDAFRRPEWHLRKLTISDVEYIRSNYKKTITNGGRISSNTVELQKIFGIGRSQVHAIVNKICWDD